jgi:hypothetical protein
MSLTLVIALNSLLVVGLLLGLAYSMSRTVLLTAHVSTSEAAATTDPEQSLQELLAA